MRQILIIKLFIAFSILITNGELSAYDEERDRLKLLHNKHRCSRRFTPGVCLESVTPVWTFEFQIMNCTERLGCPQSHRTNRFCTYQLCMMRCQPLIDLYMQILSYGGENDTRFFLRAAPGAPIRRDGSADVSVNNLATFDLRDVEYSGDEAIMSNLMYGDNDNGDNGNRNVDYVEEARDPYDYFNFH